RGSDEHANVDLTLPSPRSGSQGVGASGHGGRCRPDGEWASRCDVPDQGKIGRGIRPGIGTQPEPLPPAALRQQPAETSAATPEHADGAGWEAERAGQLEVSWWEPQRGRILGPRAVEEHDEG